jgi:hypothetical protein
VIFSFQELIRTENIRSLYMELSQFSSYGYLYWEVVLQE